MSASAAVTLEGLLALAEDPARLAEVRPVLRLLAGLDEQSTPVAMQSLTAAAERLAVHPGTVKRWCATGRMPGAIKAGSSWRVPIDSVPVQDDRAPAVPEVSTRRRSGARRAPAPARRTSAEDAMGAVITGRIRGTTPRSDPRDVRAPGGLAQRTGDPMYEKNPSAVRTAGATVTPITKGATTR